MRYRMFFFLAASLLLSGCGDEGERQPASFKPEAVEVQVVESIRDDLISFLRSRNKRFELIGGSKILIDLGGNSYDVLGLINSFYLSIGVAKPEIPPVSYVDGVVYCCYGVEDVRPLSYLTMRFGKSFIEESNQVMASAMRSAEILSLCEGIGAELSVGADDQLVIDFCDSDGESENNLDRVYRCLGFGESSLPWSPLRRVEEHYNFDRAVSDLLTENVTFRESCDQ